jgi:signal peptidase I
MAKHTQLTIVHLDNLKTALRKQGALEIELISGSMSPIMPTGTRAMIEPCQYEDLRRFDSIVFFSDGILICHSIWGLGEFRAPNGDRTIVTRGLANPLADDPVRESVVLGRVTSHRVSKGRFLFTLFWASLKLKFGFRQKIISKV